MHFPEESKLNRLEAIGSKLISLNIINLKELTYLGVNYTNITELKFPAESKLEELLAGNSKI